MKITAMLDILCFLLALLAIACVYDFLVLEKWMYLVFACLAVVLIIWAQALKVKMRSRRRLK